MDTPVFGKQPIDAETRWQSFSRRHIKMHLSENWYIFTDLIHIYFWWSNSHEVSIGAGMVLNGDLCYPLGLTQVWWQYML